MESNINVMGVVEQIVVLRFNEFHPAIKIDIAENDFKT